ncbi:MAG: tannase/feruloyl esterase family alpha/beta hydrolase [Acidobacteria bacterium]|nr:tannase/feruloyl esterase family alpha/beta hydrolase [Acidobacteriota bacterium]
MKLQLENTTIESAREHAAEGPVPATCRVTAVVTHPPMHDRVTIWVGLPLEGWNGRFQGSGGGGFAGGAPRGSFQPAAGGFAAASTDTGHEGSKGSFALDDQGRLDWQAIRNNAHLGIHEMTRIGKAVTEAFYGIAPKYAYFNGCSTGGRQGLMEAQRYPTDYDGILSGCPAINWPKLHVEQLWGPLVMRQSGHTVAACKLEQARTASIAACDALDGVSDGVISHPDRCKFDAQSLVGTAAPGCPAFNAQDASIVTKIWQGPRRQDGSFLWYGLGYGADFSGLSRVAGDPPEPQAMAITEQWFRYFLTQDPNFDWETIDYDRYERFWDQSQEEFGAVIGTDNPDLSAFRDHGGKIVLWHGLVDQLIYPGGTIDYYTRVRDEMGGAKETAKFLRFFLAPGVAHCGRGDGPPPAGHFDALMRWVEQGEAPETLDAVRRDESGRAVLSRPLCQYPQVAVYDGQGDPNVAASFTCRDER